MIRTAIVAGLLSTALLANGALAAETITSASTTLDLDKCRHRPGKAEEDYGTWRCRGHAGIAVVVSAGDQRSYVSFGKNAARELAAKQTLASFNSEGKSIEWRLQGADGKRKPFAVIMRWNTTVSVQDPPVRGQVLVVIRLGPGGVCHVGYVDALSNPGAVAMARKIADERARNFRCGVDKPVIDGTKGAGFSGPYGG